MNLNEIRICFVHNRANPGNAQYDLVKSLEKYTELDDLEIVSWFDPNSSERMEEEISITSLDGERLLLGLNPDALRNAREIVQRSDIVQVQESPSEFHMTFLSKLSDSTPVVLRDSNSHSGYHPLTRLSRYVSNPSKARIICVSGTVRDSFDAIEDRLLRDESIRTVNNGVDIDEIDQAASIGWDVREENDVEEDCVLISNVGMLTPQKDHETLIAAIDELRTREGRNIKLAIAGSGGLRPDLERTIQGKGLEDSVHLLGLLERRKVYKLLHQSDIYAMSSRWEGLSGAVLQAMATETPCVLSDIPSFRRHFDDAALFFEPGRPSRLVDTLLAVLDDEARRNEYGRRAFNCVANRYGAERMAREYADVYADLLTEK